MQKRFRPVALAGVAVVLLAGAAVFAGAARPSAKTTPLDKVDHIVVIYEENHSFDNLYGGWEGVNGRANATAAKTTQVDQQGVPYACLKQNDVNLAALAGDVHRQRARLLERVHEHVVHDRPADPADRDHLPDAADRRSRSRTACRTVKGCLVAARVTSCTSSTRSSTS